MDDDDSKEQNPARSFHVALVRSVALLTSISDRPAVRKTQKARRRGGGDVGCNGGCGGGDYYGAAHTRIS